MSRPQQSQLQQQQLWIDLLIFGVTAALSQRLIIITLRERRHRRRRPLGAEGRHVSFSDPGIADEDEGEDELLSHHENENWSRIYQRHSFDADADVDHHFDGGGGSAAARTPRVDGDGVAANNNGGRGGCLSSSMPPRLRPSRLYERQRSVEYISPSHLIDEAAAAAAAAETVAGGMERGMNDDVTRSNNPSSPTEEDDGLSPMRDVSAASGAGAALQRPTLENGSSVSSLNDAWLHGGRTQARSSYNAKILPNKVVMVRHGQSVGNISEHSYATTPDHSIPLTDLGWEQAGMAGRALRDGILDGGQTVHFIVSPYVRTMETFHGLVSAWCDPADFADVEDEEERRDAWYARLHDMGISWHEDPRIREQDFGNYQDPDLMQKSKKERFHFGLFYYRFAHGESASDVYDRVSTFLDSLWRSFDLGRYQNYVLVTHGISIRVLMARYFRYSVDEFNTLENPRNGEMVILGHDGVGKLRLEGRCELELEKTESEGTCCDGKKEVVHTKVIGYNFHERLRERPKEWTQERVIRLGPEPTQKRRNSDSPARRTCCNG